MNLYDLNSLRRHTELHFPSDVGWSQFSPDGKRLLVLTNDQTAYILDTTQLRPQVQSADTSDVIGPSR